MTLRLLDLFCGAGGAAMGYSRAGFEVVGVDLAPQPRYPFEFHQADALEYLAAHGHEFDAVHASPPCQGYSIMHNLPWLKGHEYPLLILPVRKMLEALGKPYVIENVMGARHGAKGLTKRGLEAHGLQAGWLCGTMFGLPFYRHRLFATNFLWLAPGHPKHMNRRRPGASLAGRAREIVFSATEDSRGLESWPGRRGEAGHGLTVVKRQGNGGNPFRREDGGLNIGHAVGWRLAAEAMGIDWMNRAELTQAIPPCYTEYVGAAFLARCQRPAEVAL